jgi:hypothetical protein
MERVNSTSEWVKEFYSRQYDRVVEIFAEIDKALSNVKNKNPYVNI